MRKDEFCCTALDEEPGRISTFTRHFSDIQRYHSAPLCFGHPSGKFHLFSDSAFVRRNWNHLIWFSLPQVSQFRKVASLFNLMASTDIFLISTRFFIMKIFLKMWSFGCCFFFKKRCLLIVALLPLTLNRLCIHPSFSLFAFLKLIYMYFLGFKSFPWFDKVHVQNC